MKLRQPWWLLLLASVLVQPALAGEVEEVAADINASFEQWLKPLLETDSAVLAAASSGCVTRVTKDKAEIAGKPAAPLLAVSSNVRYQGVHLAIVVADKDGKRTIVNPSGNALKNGDRFTLRVLSSFDGEVTVENINPKWQRKRIYPVGGELRCRVAAGQAATIPGGPDEYFQFADNAGEDKLVVRVYDVRGGENNRARSKVYRFDNDYGANLLQEVSFDSYPDISGVLKLRHF